MNKFFKKGFKYVDLFAGIGGFHQAMKQLNGECVFASEIQQETAQTYFENYKISAFSDITKLGPEVIPEHDVLCAGFPCQSFSKAGFQKGFDDIRGTLYFDIVRILEHHVDSYGGPKYILLENVRNLVSHDQKRTWEKIRRSLIKLGYNVINTPLIVSPHYFGIPQLRERAVILGVKIDHFDRDIDINIEKKPKNSCDMNSIIVNKDTDEYKLDNFKINEYEEKVLTMWDDFIQILKINEKIGFPIWEVEFDKEYDISNMPNWKQNIIMKNRNFYKKYKDEIDLWRKQYDYLNWVKATHRKFEWQVDNKINSVFEGIIQFRPSGVRVKQPTEFPALVAIVHVPIIGKYRRYITPREAANLQSFPQNFKINKNVRLAYKQFGNAVNVDVIRTVFEKFVNFVEGDSMYA
jgi:DNA (cytosine-5)-methyltransferase 1